MKTILSLKPDSTGECRCCERPTEHRLTIGSFDPGTRTESTIGLSLCQSCLDKLKEVLSAAADLQTFYFTFGTDPTFEHPGKCQIVKAPSMDAARQVMFDQCADEWAFGYTEEQWFDYKNNQPPGMPIEQELPTILYYNEEAHNE